MSYHLRITLYHLRLRITLNLFKTTDCNHTGRGTNDTGISYHLRVWIISYNLSLKIIPFKTLCNIIPTNSKVDIMPCKIKGNITSFKRTGNVI